MTTPSELARLLDNLDRGGASLVSSTRLPEALHDAVRAAVSLGMDVSANDAMSQALRDRVEAFSQRLSVESHIRRHPTARSSLADRAMAAARLDGDPLADQPELLAQAAKEVHERWPEATGDDVLVYASALARHAKPRRTRSNAA